MIVSLVYCFLLATHITQGFVVIQTPASRFALTGMPPSPLFLSKPGIETTQSIEETAAVSNDKSSEIETPYPVDVPSPFLLASSMLLAISSVGSLFQMMDGTGTRFSPAIALVGLPLCFFFFYAAITKAQAETEADDKAFLKDQRGVRQSNDFFN